MRHAPHVFLALALYAAPARGDGRAAPRTPAQALHDRAVRDYNLGRFDEAIEGFTRAYELEPDPVLLFDIGQAHRQRGDRTRAGFFYRRYLDLRPDAPNRADVERRIADLEAVQAPPVGSPLAAAASASPSATWREPRWRLSAEAGVTQFLFSQRPEQPAWDEPLAPKLSASGARRVGAAEVGAAASGALVPYWRQDRPGVTATAGLWTVRGQLGWWQRLGERAELGAELGVGAWIWTGLGPGNPFSVEAVGPVAAPHGHAGLVARWALSHGRAVRMAVEYERGSVSGPLGRTLTRAQTIGVSLGLTHAWL